MVRAGYDKKLRSQALLKRGRDWTRTCKQLHDEAGILPFALYEFRFSNGDDYDSFVANTTALQRAAMTVLHLGFTHSWCSKDMFWCDFGQGEEVRVQASKMDLAATFAGLSKLYVNILCILRTSSEDLQSAREWVSGLKKRNEGISVDVRFPLIRHPDPWSEEESEEDELFQED